MEKIEGYQPDPVAKSNRIRAIVPMLVPLFVRYSGIEIDSELEDLIIATIDFGAVAVSSVLLVLSKMKEQIKVKKEKNAL
jgi:hypothetical protein